MAEPETGPIGGAAPPSPADSQESAAVYVAGAFAGGLAAGLLLRLLRG